MGPSQWLTSGVPSRLPVLTRVVFLSSKFRGRVAAFKFCSAHDDAPKHTGEYGVKTGCLALGRVLFKINTTCRREGFLEDGEHGRHDGVVGREHGRHDGSCCAVILPEHGRHDGFLL